MKNWRCVRCNQYFDTCPLAWESYYKHELCEACQEALEGKMLDITDFDID